MKLLVFADLHLKYGSPYDREPGDRLEDQVKVGQRIVEIARERECSLILNAGDTFEGPIVQPEEYRACEDAFTDWDEEILSLLGNGRHDSAKRVVTAPAVCSALAVVTEPSTHEFRRSGVVVACLPWCPVDRLVASSPIATERADVNRTATFHLIEIAKGLRAECAEKYPDLPAILLGHWSMEGGVTATGVEAISFGEPILPLADLEALGFAAVFMGHVHKSQLIGSPLDIGNGIHTPARTPVIIPGSPLPLSFGESGDHGVWIFDTNSGAAEFVPIESRAFVEIEVDLREEADPMAALLAAVAG